MVLHRKKNTCVWILAMELANKHFIEIVARIVMKLK